MQDNMYIHIHFQFKSSTDGLRWFTTDCITNRFYIQYHLLIIFREFNFSNFELIACNRLIVENETDLGCLSG